MDAILANAAIFVAALSTSPIAGHMLPVDSTQISAHPSALAVAAGANHRIFVAENTDRIVSFSQDGKRLDIHLPHGTKATRVCATADGALWYVTGDEGARVADSVGRIAPSGSVSHFPLSRKSVVSAMVAASSDSVWVVDTSDRTLHRIGPSGDSRPLGVRATSVAAGADGSIWIADSSTTTVVRIASSGARKRLRVPSAPTAIVAGSDGVAWYLEAGTDSVMRLTSDGRVTSYAMHSAPGHLGQVATPQAIVAQAGGAWIVEGTNDDVVRITSRGRVATFRAPFRADPSDIALGPDGKLLLAESDGTVGVMDSSTGSTTEFSLIPPESRDAIEPDAIFPLASGQLWLVGSRPPSERTAEQSDSIGLVALDRSYRELVTSSSHIETATLDAEGALWYASRDPRIERLGLDGTHVAWPVSGAIEHLAADADGSVWAIANQAHDSVMHLSTDGGVQTVPVVNPVDLVQAPDGNVYVETCPKSKCALAPLDTDARFKAALPASWDATRTALASDGATWAGITRVARDGTLAPALDRVAPSGTREITGVPTGHIAAATDGSVWTADQQGSVTHLWHVDTAMRARSFAIPGLSPRSFATAGDTAWFAGNSAFDSSLFAPTFGSIAADGAIHEFRIAADLAGGNR